jgi:hypothetical protein
MVEGACVMAHRLGKALTRTAAHSAKKTSFWDDLMDRIAGCVLQSQLDEIEDFLAARVMDFPGSWEGDIQETIEKKREEIASEDIPSILRDKYSFT